MSGKETLVSGVYGRQILDRRGNPMVEAEVTLRAGASGRAAVPSGASKKSWEPGKPRDGGERWGGTGVMRAIDHVNGPIAAALRGIDALDQYAVDDVLLEADGTPSKERFGANAILGASLATAKAAAMSQTLPLWEWLAAEREPVIPVPLINVLIGGAHANHEPIAKEFMIVPCGASTFSEALRHGLEVLRALRSLPRERGLSTALYDARGFAPDIERDHETLDSFTEAISAAGYIPGADVWIALDPAASTFFDGARYTSHDGLALEPRELVSYWTELVDAYPIISLEDGMAKDDCEGWQELTRSLGARMQLIGDDLFLTTTDLLRRGIDRGVANSILIKPDQIGTISETLDTIKLARDNGYTAVISDRSGETEDTAIAHLAVASGCGQIKADGPSRATGVCTYNELLRIEEATGGLARFPSRHALRPTEGSPDDDRALTSRGTSARGRAP